MSSGPAPDRDTVIAVLDRLDADRNELAAMSIDALSHKDVLEVLGRMETHTWVMPGIAQRLLARLEAEDSPVELGATSMAAVVSEKLRISRDDAHKRLKDARHLGPRRTLSGERLAPKLEHTAAAQARGLIGPEHVRIIRNFFDDLPDAVDITTREQADATLAEVAAEQLPDGLHKAAARLLALLHPDGDFSDVDRARRRGITVGPQRPDGLSKVPACSTGKAAPPGTPSWPPGAPAASATPTTPPHA